MNEIKEGYYLGDIKTNKLTAEESNRLVQRAQNGDQKSKELLILANIALIKFEAKKYIGMGLSLDDLIQEGCLGFIKAIDMYDSLKNTKFTTYSLYWIRAYILRSIENTANIVRIPSHTFEMLMKYRSLLADREKEGLPPPTDSEASKILGISEHLLINARMFCGDMFSLDRRIEEDDETVDFYQVLPDTDSGNAFERVENLETFNEIKKIFASALSNKEMDILNRRFGLYPYEYEQSCIEIGAAYDITRERVRQIEIVAMRKIRAAIRHKNALRQAH